MLGKKRKQFNGEKGMTDNERIIKKLKKMDLSEPKNLGMLFDMAVNTDDKELIYDIRKKAANYGNKFAKDDTEKAINFREIYRKTLLYMAKDDFDSYLQYLEWNRPAHEKFYMPRRKVMKEVVEALQDLTDDKLDELFLSMPPRVGKLLSNDTPVLTTKGWKNHGDIIIGDEVYGADGKPKRVIAVHPKHHTTHKVTLTDGTSYDVHENHEWLVYDRTKSKIHIMETKEMIGRLENGKKYGNKRGHRYNFQIPLIEPIVGKKTKLPVKPYTFGAWLGDGTNQKPCITGDKKDFAIIDAIENEGYKKNKVYTHKTTGVLSTTFVGLADDLKKVGLCNWRERTDKYIPECYLTASIEQRLELIAGLLDTDGTLVKKEHRYNFTTSDERLKDDFISLISTFSWRCSVKEIQPSVSSSGIVGKKVYWCIGFNPNVHIPCRLERKQLYEFSKQRKIAIKSIEPENFKEGNCITVEGGLYRVGERLTLTHNTSILMFYVTWIIGKRGESSNLYSAFSDIITSAFYQGVLEVLQDSTTYLWADVFPTATVAGTNAKDETLNINRKRRYPTLTCRSLYGTLNGACDCNGILISDDLIGGIEEALNKDRLAGAWNKVDNNLIPRSKECAKILWCGTRWSNVDPAGLRMELLENEEKYKNRRVKIINLPALDENDESNFNYDFGVGFSTEYYHQRRASFERNNDIASWLAQYMGEPIEREGALFSPDDLRYYNGTLPDGEPDRIFMAIDPAWGGGDFVASPICYQYGTEIYVPDVVYDSRDKSATQKIIAEKVLEHKVQAMQFEVNKSTMSYKEGVEEKLITAGYKANIMTKSAPTGTNKFQRIFDKAPDIRETMIFLENGKRSKEYSLFMQNVFSYKIYGKNKNDDAPDSLSMAINMVRTPQRAVKIFSRPI